MSEVLLYLADKAVDFLLAILLIVIGYYINKWLDRVASALSSSERGADFFCRMHFEETETSSNRP